MRRAPVAAVTAALALALASCASLDKPFAKVQVYPIDEIDDSEAAILIYPGNAFLTLNLYKVDGAAKSEPYYLSFPGSYSQFKTVGFGIKVAPGAHSIELVNLKKKEIVRLSGELPKGRCELRLTKEGYEVVAEDGSGKADFKAEPVASYDVPAPGAATLRLAKLKEDLPVVLRINGMPPAALTKEVWGNYAFADTSAAVELPLREGRNVVEYLTYEDSATIYNSFLILAHAIEFDAEPGKIYTIARPKAGESMKAIEIE
jgi:hypothetical protein